MEEEMTNVETVEDTVETPVEETEVAAEEATEEAVETATEVAAEAEVADLEPLRLDQQGVNRRRRKEHEARGQEHGQSPSGLPQ